MKISFNWLKDYVELPQGTTPEEVAQKLTFSGLEVEACTSLAKGLEKVFVGQILERKQHPNADRLSLTVIDVGTALSPGGEKLEIVCGAQNIKAGQKIPVATLGGIIPNGLEIKAAKIRGVASCGMLCSLDELMLPKEWQAEDGIFLLDENAEVGMPFAKYLDRDDTILEISVTANRGDALSHFGVAREVAALYGKVAKLPEVKALDTGASKYSVELANPAGRELCPTYYAKVIEGVNIGPSPKWLQQKIEAIGLRSINNVVDITSFVMFEMGQPLHAFDADKLVHVGNKIKISVRTAKEGEKFITLADKEVELKKEDLVISSGENGEKAVALAGVMGGKNSEVDDGTVNVLLEAAEFHPVHVRKTGRRLALLTDAGYRFERGVDSGRVDWAMNRAAQLICELAGGKAKKHTQTKETLEQAAALSVRLRLTEIQKILGKSPELNAVIGILRSLSIPAELAPGEKDVIQVQIPKWRKDLKRSIDLVEEVARIWGFDHLEAKLPLAGIGQEEPKESKRRSYFQLRRVRRHLTSLGFYEALNYGFTSPEELQKILSAEERSAVVEIANPVSNDYSILKPSLLPGLLRNAVFNISHKTKNIRLFEMRRTFTKASETQGKDPRTETGVKEVLRLCIVWTGDEIDEFWLGKAPAVDFYSMKGVLDSILEILGQQKVQYQPGSNLSYLHPGQCASLQFGNRVVGAVGRLHPRIEKDYDLGQDTYMAELDLDQLVANDSKGILFKAYGNFPVVERDFSAQVPDSVNADAIRKLVAKVAKPLLKELRFFDVYKGSRVPAGHISYAFRITLGSEDHTLTDQEINGVQENLMRTMEKEFQARFAGL